MNEKHYCELNCRICLPDEDINIEKSFIEGYKVGYEDSFIITSKAISVFINESLNMAIEKLEQELPDIINKNILDIKY